MKMKITSYSAIVGILILISNMCIAGESTHEFSANVAYTTNYMYRGFTQTSEGPAIQGGFDYAHSSGFYAGTWASSLEFGGGDDDTNIEIDYYAGFGGDIGSTGLSYDLGALYYQYPNTNADAAGDFDFLEFYGNLSYTFNTTLQPTIGVGLAYSSDYFGEDDDSLYATGSLDVSLPYDVGLSFLVGNLNVDGDKTSPGGFDYTHFAIGMNKPWSIFDFDVTYYDAGNDCGTNEQCESVVFTVSGSF